MKFVEELLEHKNGIKISGLTFELNVFYVLKLLKKYKNIIVLTSSLYEANKYADELKGYNEKTYIFPMDEFLTSVTVAASPDLKFKRLETLDKISENTSNIVVTNLTGFLKYLPNANSSGDNKLYIERDKDIKRDVLLEKLELFGYNRTDLVLSSGEYAVRGNIVDIFLLNEESPIRIDFFGDTIDSIRYFDPNTQRSINEINSLECEPIEELKDDNPSSLLEYLPGSVVVIINKSQLEISIKKLREDILAYNESQATEEKYMYDFEEIAIDEVVYLNSLDDSESDYQYESSSIVNFNSDYELLNNFVHQRLKRNKEVIICVDNKKYRDFLLDKIENSVLSNLDNILIGKINIVDRYLHHGFEIDKYVVISQYDIEKEEKSIIKYNNPLKSGKRVKDVSDLSAGDYVVHVLHGIGVYNGVITLTKNGLKKDYVLLNYKGNDKVYIPVEKISNVYKYLSKDGLKPKIDSLNSTSWQKTKASLRKRVKDISDELIRLYAARSSIKGPVFIDQPEEELFASQFQYQLTRDQEKAISDINFDLRKEAPMDRLLCGDVGFGKTEVAFRAMFKTVYNGYQVLYLCPTTILSRQQYLSACARFKEFPIEIALLNRFTSAKEAKRIFEGLQKGTIDIVFGTHRLLNESIEFRRLGLLIVDEEQRFGVTHKERLKKYKNDVNVLTLSATPIPRTLKMALSGLRDLSLIDTPPVNRYPVQTYVLEENALFLKDSIYKELSRNGQVFILYNKTETIVDEMHKIGRLVPEARITYAHGKMSKKELEDVMQDFIDYKYDILVCTTIIETGIDIPNVNTLIVLNADNFGLSQLYQLRGRVGRSNKIAYAYLFFNKDKLITEIATKRLEAIKEFTELGSGYRIAMRDLALRGAGDILGSEQAGFVDTVGLELYMKMIEEEINSTKGIEPEKEESDSSLIDVETHISDDYVSDESIKIEIHKMINSITDYQSLLKIKEELEDRFGKVNDSIMIYMYEEWFEKLAKRIGIKTVTQTKLSITVELPGEISENIKGDKLFIKAYNICPKFRLKYINKKVVIELPLLNLEKHFLYYLIPLLEEIDIEINS